MVPAVVFWIVFHVVILGLLALDLGIFTRKAHRISTREAALHSAGWILLALMFAAGVWLTRGHADALAFLTGYVLEKSLSVDNIFVFVLIFRAFAVPPEFQPKVLQAGVVGALAMRALLIAAGAVLLHTFHWAIYVFGGIIIWSGARMLLHRTDAPHLERTPLLGLARRVLPLASGDTGDALIARHHGARQATPLLLVLVLVEGADLLFALDSIPAIFAVTGDPVLVYTSNVFAILGLRALYFMLAGVLDRVRYLNVGLAAILIFTGIRMLLEGVYPLPVGLMLGVIAVALGLSVAASLRHPRGRGRRPGDPARQAAP